jgi:hypothetical protein
LSAECKCQGERAYAGSQKAWSIQLAEQGDGLAGMRGGGSNATALTDEPGEEL